jgi:hypothetical protein
MKDILVSYMAFTAIVVMVAANKVSKNPSSAIPPVHDRQLKLNSDSATGDQNRAMPCFVSTTGGVETRLVGGPPALYTFVQ